MTTPLSAISRDHVNGAISHADSYLVLGTPIDATTASDVAGLLETCKFLLHGLLDRYEEEDSLAYPEFTVNSDTDNVLEVFQYVCDKGYNHPGRAARLLRTSRELLTSWKASSTTLPEFSFTNTTPQEILTEKAAEATTFALEHPPNGFQVVWDFTCAVESRENNPSKSASRASSRASTRTRRKVEFDLPLTPEKTSPQESESESEPEQATPRQNPGKLPAKESTAPTAVVEASPELPTTPSPQVSLEKQQLRTPSPTPAPRTPSPHREARTVPPALTAYDRVDYLLPIEVPRNNNQWNLLSTEDQRRLRERYGQDYDASGTKSDFIVLHNSLTGAERIDLYGHGTPAEEALARALTRDISPRR